MQNSFTPRKHLPTAVVAFDYARLSKNRKKLSNNVARLDAQIAAQQAAGAAWQGLPGDEALVFTSCTGSPIEPKNFSRAFKLICKKHGIRVIRLHDVRHTQATLLKDLSVSPRDAQLILGHASIVTTQQIYQHPSLEASDRALRQVEELLRQSFDRRNDSVTAAHDNECCRQTIFLM